MAERDASLLLHIGRSTGNIHHRKFREVLDLLQPGDLLVLNDTRVTAMRVFGTKPTGGQVELLLLRDLGNLRFEALARPGKRLQPGSLVNLEEGLLARIEKNLDEGRKIVQILGEDAGARLDRIGLSPLPPYIQTHLPDRERYQTVYNREGGSAAAPTAGLHFTPEILDALRAKGVKTAWVTLDVGLDTFRPITAENPFDHEMHGELCRLPAETRDAIANGKGRIIAVGTTATRTLESFATGKRQVRAGEQSTKIFIRPGYEFLVIDGMFTNFHMPRTTMLLMISALAGSTTVREAYHEALQRDYRFLSFGDSMLIL